VFRGVNVINLDPKGRMAMPARYRDQLVTQFAGRLVATIDPMAKCLLLYPIDVWEEIQKKIESLSSFNADTRKFQRMMIGYATDLELDSSGPSCCQRCCAITPSWTNRLHWWGRARNWNCGASRTGPNRHSCGCRRRVSVANCRQSCSRCRFEGFWMQRSGLAVAARLRLRTI